MRKYEQCKMVWDPLLTYFHINFHLLLFYKCFQFFCCRIVFSSITFSLSKQFFLVNFRFFIIVSYKLFETCRHLFDKSSLLKLSDNILNNEQYLFLLIIFFLIYAHYVVNLLELCISC